MATTMDRGGAPTAAGRGTPPINPGPNRRAPWPVQFYASAVGKKWVMGLTGLALMGFVLAHAIGNLKVYLGPEEFNHYGEFLRDLLVPILPRTVTLWLMRTGLIVAAVAHIHSAYSLTRMNHRANGSGYVSSRDWQAATAASRSMRWTGIIIGLFLLFHLADLTWGTVNPDFVRGDVYRNFFATFDRPVVSVIYIVANVALALHLFHGAWSMFQSMGLNNPRWNSWRRGFSAGFAGVVLAINVSFPVAVMTGLVDAHERDECTVRGDTVVSCEGYEAEESQS